MKYFLFAIFSMVIFGLTGCAKTSGTYDLNNNKYTYRSNQRQAATIASTMISPLR